MGNVLRKRKDEVLVKSSEPKLLEIGTEMEVVIGSLQKAALFSHELSMILKISLETGLCFYDASLFYLAQRENRVLLTEDPKLARVAKEHNTE